MRIVRKFKPQGPDHNILTIDATLGQNSIQQARIFTENIGINGLMLTKFDGTAKGGAIIPICNELMLPVLYLGVGEGINDILEFDPKRFVAALFD
jgi:fused signal recognition particle receptor